MSRDTLPKEIMQGVANLRKKNIEIHEKYCKYIIEDKSFKKRSDWEKQQVIDMLTGVLHGSPLSFIDANLQMGEGNVKSIFLTHGLDIE